MIPGSLINTMVGVDLTPPDSLLDSFLASVGTGTRVIYTGNVSARGQVIALGASKSITRVKFRLSKTGSPTGNGYARLYNVTGTPGAGGTPTGASLGSVSIDVSTLSTSIAAIEFAFSSAVSVSSNVGLIFEYNGENASNCVNIEYDLMGGHAGNAVLYESGAWSSWGDDTSFYIYGY